MSTDLLGTISRDGDRVAVAFERRYPTDAADLWEVVTDQHRLARWFAPVEGELNLGGSFVIRFDDDDSPVCRVERCEPGRSFSWSWPHDRVTSRVDVEVLPDGEDAVLRVVHSRLTQPTAAGYAAGWQAYLRRLDVFVPDPDHAQDGDWWADFDAVRHAYVAAVNR